VVGANLCVHPLWSVGNMANKIYICVLVTFIAASSGCTGDKKDVSPNKQGKSPIAANVGTGLKSVPQPESLHTMADITKEGAAEERKIKPNELPEVISIRLSPRLVYPGTIVKAEAEGRDPDGDLVSLHYEWKKNEETVFEGSMDELKTDGFKKGDFITVFVTPSDGKMKGKTRKSIPLIIANRPPEIKSTPSTEIVNGKYTYKVEASDPDGDVLTFSLEESPAGMAIDPAAGIIKWDIPAVSPDSKTPPSYNVKVLVSDGDAKAFQGFSLTLKR